MNKNNLSTSSSDGSANASVGGNDKKTKKNIIFIGKLFLFLAIFIAYLNVVSPQYLRGFNASLIDKVARLESINEPKIVLLGNSNVVFGFDSKMIEDALGMPVVNMGLHGGNGNPFHEEMSKYNITPGDIYVLCHTAYSDDDGIVEPMTAWATIENHFHLWKLLRLKDVRLMADAFPVYIKKCFNLYASGEGNRDYDNVYSRSAINEYGDVGIELKDTEYTFDLVVYPDPVYDTTIERINELNKYITDRGATLVVGGYPTGNGGLTSDSQRLVDLQEELKEKLDCMVISNYTDYMFDYLYYFNTGYHLNTEGAKLRTAQLIADLSRWMSTGREASIEEDMYTDIIADDELSHEFDPVRYLEAIDKAKDRYTVIVAARDNAVGVVDAKVQEELEKIGFAGCAGEPESYIGIVENGEVVMDSADSLMQTEQFTFDDGRVNCVARSAGIRSGSNGSIYINDREYSRNVSGLNIVVYSNELHRVLDRAALFIDEEGNLKIKREDITKEEIFEAVNAARDAQ